MNQRFRVRVPATSANLGPGYDCAGLALGLYDELEAHLTDSGDCVVAVTGEGADAVPRDDSHLVVRAIARAFADAQRTLPGLELRCINRIPHGRGLGSSSAAIVAGLVLGRALLGLGEEAFSDARILELATEIEGHPDNVAPALLGGFTIAWTDEVDGGIAGRAIRLEPSDRLQPVVAIARTPLATEQARSLLPATVPHPDAASNAGRAALLVAAMTNETSLLLPATQDRLHQDFRRFAYPDSYSLVTGLRAKGIPSAISGAGPTVIAFGLSGSEVDLALVEQSVNAVLARDATQGEFDVAALPVDLGGVTIERVEEASE